MNREFWLIFSVCVAIILAAEVCGRRVKERTYVDPDALFDAVDKRDNEERETNALKELNSASMSRSFINDFKLPECDFSNWTSPICCLSATIFNEKYEICGDVLFNLRRLTINAALTVNEAPLIEAEFSLAKICVRYPTFPKLSLCAHVYYFDCNFGSPLFIETCLTVIIADLLELRFYCIKYDQGELTREDDIEPEDKGPFAVLFKRDRVVFEFNTAIPEMLWEMVKGICILITDTVMVIIEKSKEIARAVIDTIADFFSPKRIA